MKKNNLEIGHGYELVNGAFILVTQHDRHNNTITAIPMDSVEEIKDFQHKVSLDQFPQWHKENCDVCNNGSK